MSSKPTSLEVWQAIQTYLEIAYGGQPPPTVQARLETLRSLGEDELYHSPLFEHDTQDPASRYSLRMGNRFYPHMKLSIDRRPDNQGYLFRADTHDRHCCPPPTNREYEAFVHLMDENQKLAQAVERAWEQRGLPTFKTYLRDDLARRSGIAANP